MRNNPLLLALPLLLGVTLAAETPAGFTKKPTAVKAGEKIRIEFEVNRKTDVAVYILDSGGKVIRHLVAGVIGGQSKPPKPLKPGLAQSMVWDLRDNSGSVAKNGPFKIRVRLGIKPEFDDFILNEPRGTGAVTSVAVGPKGDLYLWHRDVTANANQGSNKLKVIDRDGKYVKTLLPYAASLPAEKAKVFGAMTDEAGNLVPRIYNLQQLALTNRGYTARGRTHTSGGIVDSKGRVFWLMASARLAGLNADGSCAFNEFPTKTLLPEFTTAKGWGSLAMSSDEKHLYIVGMAKAKNKWDKKAQVASCVWRTDLATLMTETFLGDPAKPGKEKGLLTKPVSVVVAKGLIYVADAGADRIVVFKEKDKSYAGEIKIKAPISVGVDPATGAVYVSIRTGKNISDLVKLSGYSGAREVSRFKLPKSYGTPRIAVDASARPVRILLPTMRWRGMELHCIEDSGTALKAIGDPRKIKTPWAPGPRDLTVDRTRGELYVKYGTQKYYRVDGKSGKVLDKLKVAGSGANATQLVVSPDGSLVTLSWRIGIQRLDRKGKPLNWEGRDTNKIPYGGIMTFQERYMAMTNPKEIMIMLPGGYSQKKKAKGTCLNVLDTAGKTKRTLIWLCSQGAVPRVDAKGNIYIADMVKPKDRSYPEFFDGKMPPYKHNGASIGGRMVKDAEHGARFWTSSMYGSIIKFPPDGGAIWYGKDPCVDAEGKPSAKLLAKPRVTYKRHIGYNFKPVDVQGAEWVRFGFAPYGEARGAGFCMCEGVGFDVDGFGRVFYPNLGQFRIEMVDTNNNWIGSFGKYGTQDTKVRAASSKSSETADESPIPLAWPTYVAVDDDYAYVNDTLSNRVVRVKLGCEAEEVCAVK
jgi:DNA-binding beta-propeller fold protein YncE